VQRMLPAHEKGVAPVWVPGLIWGGLLMTVVLHMAGPCLPPPVTLGLFVALALHCC
jgi:hypothetical protein